VLQEKAQRCVFTPTNVGGDIGDTPPPTFSRLPNRSFRSNRHYEPHVGSSDPIARLRFRHPLQKWVFAFQNFVPGVFDFRPDQ
jgi:hypothetical protein